MSNSVDFLSWNVNGIRACCRQSFVTSVSSLQPDVIGLQEVRATPEQIPSEIKELPDFPHQFYLDGEKKGYSGVAILSRMAPEEILRGIGSPPVDREARVLTGIFPKFIFTSAYFPNSQDKGKRIAFKIEFCDHLESWLLALSKKHPCKPIVLSGDFNIAHEEIDLARPDENHETAGFLPQERSWMTRFLSHGWIDSFRYLHPKTVRYSWWSARTRARARNIGWRIDYHALYNVNPKSIRSADIHDQIFGSDHCPVTLRLEL